MAAITTFQQHSSGGASPEKTVGRIAQPTDHEEHVVILGAGNNTRGLLEAGGDRLRGVVRAILDDDPRLAGRRVAGVLVSPPGGYPLSDVQRVIIASETYQQQLTERARELFGSQIAIEYGFDRRGSFAGRLSECFELVRSDWPAPCPDAVWLAADQLRQTLDDRLSRTPNWRYGVSRQLMEFRELCETLPRGFSWRGMRFYNFGCGRYVPHGQSLLAVLAGAAGTLATDLSPPLNLERTAAALRELVSFVVLNPREIPGAPSSRAAVIETLERVIDLDRLATDAWSGAIDTRRIAYRTESIYNANLPQATFDVIASRAVFEHLPDVPAALARLYHASRPGGFVYLIIDYSDHRRYQNPDRYRHWSHLIDLDEPTYLDTNRLRHSDYAPLFSAAGFEIVSNEPCDVEELPPEEIARLAPRYRTMPPDELAVASARILLRRAR